jgi:hypothetical protein
MTQNDNIKTFCDLYTFLQNYNNPIIEWLKEPWVGKDKQESILRLFTSLNLINKFNEFDMCIGNFNNVEFKKIENLSEFFYKKENIERNLKDKGDSSDLTCINKIDNHKILVTTSKNLSNITIGKLDIDKIINIINEKYKDYEMILCIVVKDKEKLNKMIKNIESTNNHLKELIIKKSTIIIDWKDLETSFYKFKLNFEKIQIHKLLKSNKTPIILKLHQDVSVQKTIIMKNEKIKKILWGHIQRSGKSYIMCGCIIQDSKDKKECNYLIITTAPNETIDQYIKVFNCSQLKNFNVIQFNRNTKEILIEEKNIIICSKQFLQNKIENSKKSIDWLKEMKFNMRFIDESHNGGTTELAKKVLSSFGKNSCTIQITATYSKPVNDFDIPKENWILWDLEDIKLCQNINIQKNKERLIEKHGEIMKNTIKNYCNDDIINDYKNYPELHILTEELNKENVKKLVEKIKDTNYGYSTESCMLLKQNTNEIIEKFQNEKEILKLWYRIFGKYNDIGVPYKEYPDNLVFMKRIEKICNNPEFDSRTIDTMENPMIIMAFLPQDNIEKLSNTTIKLLKKYDVIPNFEIISINSSKTNTPKQDIENAQNKAKINNKKGVLVLSGRQCSLGVTIKDCDIIILLNNSTSYDMIYQMMFRCMTEEKNKKCGFIIDMNINRVIGTTLIEYSSLIKPYEHPRESIKYILQERLINLNADQWMTYFGHNEKTLSLICKKVYDIYSSDTEKALKHFLDRLHFKEILLSNDEQKMFNIMFNGKSPTIEQKKIIEEYMDKPDKINKGIEKIKISVEKIGEEEETKEKKKNYMDILKHIIPLICILTIHNDKTSFTEMYEMIETDKYIYDILIDQTKSWWGDTIDTIIIKNFIILYDKYIKDDKETSQIIRTVKELFTKNINNIKKLSKLIDKYLIPQELEKKKNAEISTPYQLRKDMLDKMPLEFWKNKNKVFEPCCGKGGFLIDIIDRFMDGLKDIIENKKERYKIIVEELLYWSDINSTNIFICKLLLDPYNEYKLNYNEGDTLKLDIKQKWNIKNFDAVIGNPPYQAIRKKENQTKGGGGDLLWNKFVVKSINEWIKKNGYLIFVHPAGWRKPCGLNVINRSKCKNLYQLMTNDNQMIYLNINNTKEGLNVFGCGTRYDYYILKKCKIYTDTYINDETNTEIQINLKNIPFIPNKNILKIMKIISINSNNNLNVLRPGGDPRREYINDTRNKDYCYKMIHSTPKNGVRYKYCNEQKKSDHFKIKKIIFGETGYDNMVLDKNGKYGCTCCSFGIEIIDENFEIIKKALLTIEFKEIINSCSWSNFRIDWRLFTYFKKDFWKEFI